MSLILDGTTGVTFPAGGSGNVAGTVVGTSDTQSLTNKSLNGASFGTVSGSAPLFLCRAWVNFNGTGTVAIRASGNASSLVDNGTGDYTVNFTTAMPDANYSLVGTASDCVFGANLYIRDEGTVDLFTGSARILVRSGNGASPATADPEAACVSIFR